MTPMSISKPVRSKIVERENALITIDQKTKEVTPHVVDEIDNKSLTPFDRKRIIKKLEREMKNQAEQMNFEFAIQLRDKVRELKDMP